MARRLHRRFAAWLALVALFGATLVAPLAHAAAMQAAGGFAADVCSVAGTPAPAGDAFAPTPAPADHDTALHVDCASCCASASPLAAPVAMPAPALPPAASPAVAPHERAPNHGTPLLQRGAPPRAPPVSLS